MNKAYILIPLLALGGCARLTGDAYNDDDTYAEETGLYIEETQPRPQSWQNAPVNRPQPPVQQARVLSDGMTIELPAQQIYLGNETRNTVPVAPLPPQMTGPAPIQGISYSMPVSGANYQPRPQAPAMVTLQNMAYPNTYAQCVATDTVCVSSYEQQGYRQVQGIPQFAGYQDVLAPSDYPQNGRFRNGNNIPRW